MESQKKGFFSDIKIHIVALALVLIAEFIGVTPITLGPLTFSLLPMLFALVFGILLSQIKGLKILTYEDMIVTSPYIGIAVMYLLAFMGSAIGPNIESVLNVGPALILQELGNLGTIFFALPIAVLVFKMDRTAIGSSFSTSRESSLAIVGDLYGLDSPEGRGVMGSYITGTLLGTIFCGVLASGLMNISWFKPEALAMAAGTGSASMMSASIGPIVEAFPERAQEFTALAASSQVLTGVDGLYLTLFAAIPLTNWLYEKLKGKEAVKAELEQLEAEKEKMKEAVISEEDTVEMPDENDWSVRLKILGYTAVFASISNWISSSKAGAPVTPLEALPGLLWMFGIVVSANLLKDFFDSKGKSVPTILYISILSTILSIPAISPVANTMNASMAKISLLPLTTPILAYAGIATGKDMVEFKKQGAKIIIVTLCALAGTYVGSAVIANIVLTVTGRA